jgi:hypothetical protein
MNTVDAILQKWCKEFMIEPNWPDNLSLEEQLDRYFFPQLHKNFTEIANDREYYQTRFYMMQWAFRKLLKAYGQVVKDLEQEHIRFLPDDLIKALKQEHER